MPDATPRCDVVIAIDWPMADATDRQWATELAVASLGWGSRFGSDFAPTFLVPDPTDAALPSGIAMYAASLSDGIEALPITPPLIVLLGTQSARATRVAAYAVQHRIPCLVRAGTAWATDTSIRSVGRVASALGAMITAILDGVGLPTDDTGVVAVSTPTPAVTRRVPEARVVHEQPRVAIVIPTYNRADYLTAAIDSALSQTYPHVEVIVADDGSTDATATVAHGRASHGVRYFSKPHTNGPDTRNKVLAGIDAPFIVWLGDDDLLTPTCVASRVDMLARYPRADVIYGNLLTVNADLEPTGSDVVAEDWFGRDATLLATLFERNPITEGGALVRHEKIRQMQGYDPAFPKAHDYEFWSRLAPHAAFKHDPGTSYIWRWHGGNMGLGSGANPYQDAHVRIVLGLLSRHAPQELFPNVPWHQLDTKATEGVASLLSAVRLWREDAIDFALQFAERAVECWPTQDSRTVLAQLQARQRERARANESVLVTA